MAAPLLEKLKFYIVKPQAATNYVTNPTPYLATTGYTALTGSFILFSDTETRRGPMCLQVTPSTAESGVYFSTISVTDTQDYAFSVDVKGEEGKAMRIQVEDAGATYTYETTFTATGYWQRISVTFTAEETAADYRLYVIRDATTGTNAFYVDGFQFEDNEETTFFSGDTKGFGTGKLEFGWNGTPRASTSYRTVNTQAGGALLDISDHAQSIITAYGLGAGNYQQLMTDLISGGSYYQGFIQKSRNFSLLLSYHGDNQGDLQADRKAILDYCKPKNQKMVVRYQGLDTSSDEASNPVDIVCVPQPSHNDTPDNPLNQKALLNFTIPSGLLAGAYKEGADFGSGEETVDSRYILQQNLNTGEWSEVGGGLNGIVYVAKISPDGDLYVGGTFVNAGGDADADYIAKWDGTSWSAVGTPNTGTASITDIRDIAFTTQGHIYVVGTFTNFGDDADADYIAKWNGVVWSGAGTPNSGSASITAIHSIVLDDDQNVYVGGNFTDLANVASADYIAKYDGSSWTALDTGLNGIVYDVKIAANDDIYACGAFTDAGGDTDADYIAKYDGSSWSAFGTGLNATCYTMALSSNGILYAGGSFTTAGGSSAARVARWSGAGWSALGDGVDDTCYGLYMSSNNELYCVGAFTEAGGLYYANRMAIYTDNYWRSIDILLSGSNPIYAIVIGLDNTLYIGGNFLSVGTSTIAEITSMSVNTDADTYPTLYIVGTGRIQSITNYTSGKRIEIDGLNLNQGETLTMIFDPGHLSIISDWRGDCMKYVVPGSNIGNFTLESGSNNIGVFIPVGQSATTNAYIEYTPQFDGIEGAKHD